MKPPFCNPISGARQDSSLGQREHQLACHPVVHVRGPCPRPDDRRSGLLPETILRGQARGVNRYRLYMDIYLPIYVCVYTLRECVAVVSA